jgi:DNA-directed RNA polymerase subunit K/omega|tara:strand:+ start:969 stop:1304 length:336 start_codon:yes stop_codon:yes gene_type:complete
MTEDHSSDEEEYQQNEVISSLDLEVFYSQYEVLKKTYLSNPNLNKYEKTKIISERAQQLANGSLSFLKNPESYNNVLDIAMEELKQKKIPIIIERPVPNGFEYWKLEDCTL